MEAKIFSISNWTFIWNHIFCKCMHTDTYSWYICTHSTQIMMQNKKKKLEFKIGRKKERKISLLEWDC